MSLQLRYLLLFPVIYFIVLNHKGDPTRNNSRYSLRREFGDFRQLKAQHRCVLASYRYIIWDRWQCKSMCTCQIAGLKDEVKRTITSFLSPMSQFEGASEFVIQGSHFSHIAGDVYNVGPQPGPQEDPGQREYSS